MVPGRGWGRWAVAVAMVAAGCPGRPSPAQEAPRETGDPFLRVYLPQEYGAFYQSADILQGPEGMLYVANNSGVLAYDGQRWHRIPLAGGAPVRSLALGPQGRVYVGGMSEAGYLERDGRGFTVFRSLLGRLGRGRQDQAEFLKVAVQGDRVLFLEAGRLTGLTGDGKAEWRPQGMFTLGERVQDRFFVVDTGRGLLELKGRDLEPVPGLSREEALGVISIQPWGQGLLLATLNRGLFLHDGRRAVPFRTACEDWIREGQMRQILVLADGTLLLGTLRAGLLRLSPQGELLDRVGQEQGLSSDDIRRMTLDDQGGVWVVLGNGLARLEWPSPLTRFTKSRGLSGVVFTCHRHQGRLYAGTEQGLFRLEGTRFRLLPGITGSVWQMLSCGDRLLVAHRRGISEVRDGRARPLLDHPTSIYALHRLKRQPEVVLAGHHNGVIILRSTGGTWKADGSIPGLEDHVRTFVEEGDGSLWLGTFVHGVLRLEGGVESPSRIRRYGVAEGLPSLTHTYVHRLGGQLRVTTHKGIYHYRQDLDRFEPDPAFACLFPDRARWIYGPAEDAQGRIWMHSSDEVNRLEASGVALPGPDGRYRWEPRPMARAHGAWVESILPEADGVVWFCGSDGLLRLDSQVPRTYESWRAVHLQAYQVSTGGRRILAPPMELPYRENHVRFEFALPSFNAEQANRFRTLLEGHEADWSAWGAEPFREYTSLREGHYRFRVQAVDLYGNVSGEAQFPLYIRPPWYRSPWAFLAEGLAGVGLVYLLVRWRLSAVERENRRLEARVSERTHHLERLNAIVDSINQNLDMDDLLEAILRETRVIQGADRACVLIREGGQDSFRFHPGWGWDPETPGNLCLSAAEAEARYTRDALSISDDIFVFHLAEGRAGQGRMGPAGEQPASLVLRICLQGQVEAYFVFDSLSDAKAFDQQDLDLLEGLRSHFVSAVMKARNVETLRVAKAAAEQARDELGQLNERLYQLNDEKNRLIGVAAHDLRNPLSGVLLSCELLAEDLPPEARGGLHRIQDQVRRANELIQDLLDVHAIEANAAEVSQGIPVDPAAVIARIHQAFEARAASKEILIVPEVTAVPAVRADPRHLQRVLENLVSNAVKYSPRGKRVWIRAHPVAGFIRFEVQDEGPGLTEADRARVFLPYARLSAKPTAGEPSVGLGLSIVRKLVEGMGGALGVEGGPGALFWFTLPLADGSQAGAAVGKGPGQGA